MLCIATLLSQLGNAQEISCNMLKLPFAQMVDESNSIAYAEVTAAQSFWNEKHSMIYTHYTLNVIQSLKSDLPQTVTLVVEGGRATGIQIDYQDRIELLVGAQIVVMLERIPKYWDCGTLPSNSYSAYASKQGLFVVDPVTLETHDPFKRFSSLSELFDAVKEEVGKQAQLPQAKNVPAAEGVSSIAVLASFSPTTITAGTGSVLTISGSGFGATRGNGFVEFSIVDGTFAQPLAKDYITWTDTQIQLYVPSLTLFNGAVKETAATGPIRVTPDGGTAVASPTSLNIKYSMFNRYNSQQDSAVTFRLINADLQGGYTLKYNDQFSTLGAGAQASLERALSTWKCATQVNFKISSSTTSIRAVAIDNTSVITDDVQAPLPVGILGRGVSITGLCVNGPLVKALTVEMDIIIDATPGLTWNFSTSAPSFTQYDFETVLLHEFGHVHQLAHTASGSTNIMAPTVSSGVMNRSLQPFDLEGGLDVMARAQTPVGCNINSHVSLTSSLSITSNVVFPICNGSSVTFTAVGTNITANATLNWFKNGIQVAQGNSYTLSNLANNDVIFCQYNACTTVRSNSITAAVTSNTATISYAASYCRSTITAQNVNRTGVAGGTYSATPAGLSINATTGAITPSASTVGAYTVTYSLAASGPCPSSTTTTQVTIVASPFVTLSYGSGTVLLCKASTGTASATVTSSGAPTFTASPAGLVINASTGAITPSTSTVGTYTVTASVTGTGSCAGVVVTATSQVTIVASPFVTISYGTGTVSFCKSTSGNFAAAYTTNGTPTFSASPAGLTINTTTGAITPSTSTVGTYTITASVTGTGACAGFVATSTAQVTIVASPFVTLNYGTGTGTVFLCKSTSGSVAATVSSSGTPTFSASPAGLVINASTGAITPSTSTAGTYTVTASVTGTGACAGVVVTATRSVTIVAPLATPAAITGVTTNACGLTRTFSIASVAGAASYTWTVPAGATVSGSSSGTSITLVFSNSFSTGTLSVRANSLTGCNSGLRSTTIQGAPSQPGTMSTNVIVAGLGSASVGAVSGATSYLWTISSGFISFGQGTNSVNFDAGFLPSSVNICVRAVNSCGQSVVRCKTVSLAQSGGGAQSQMISEEPIENEKLVDPTIFPNPSEDIINLSFEDSELNDNLTVDLLDAGGMLIQRLNYQSTYGTTMQVSLSDLPAGMYMFRMSTVDGQVATKRFVKQ